MQLVLAADKDPHACRMISDYLGDRGFRVEIVRDGVSALEKARLLRPALIISAILLPKTDGLALCRQIKEDPEIRAIPVLICCILAATARAQEAGANAFLSKPLSKSRLIKAVLELLPEPTCSEGASCDQA